TECDRPDLRLVEPWLRACAVSLREQADRLQERGLRDAGRVRVDLEHGLPLTVATREVVGVVAGKGAVVTPGGSTGGRVARQAEAVALPREVEVLLGMCRLHREQYPGREQRAVEESPGEGSGAGSVA